MKPQLCFFLKKPSLVYGAHTVEKWNYTCVLLTVVCMPRGRLRGHSLDQVDQD